MPATPAHPITVVDSDHDFSAMHERMQWYIDEGILSCCATVVMKGDDVVDCRTFGVMDLDTGEPLRADAIYRMYSNTKLVTSVALMRLHEQGLFQLDDPVARWIPGLANPRVLRADATGPDDTEAAGRDITVRHLLSHSAGLSYGFIEPESVIDTVYTAAGLNPMATDQGTLAALCDRLADVPLAYRPGTGWRYSVATDVCARLVEVLSGQRFSAHLQQHVFGPLGMVDTAFHVPPEKTHRFTTMYAPVELLKPMAPGLVKADDPHDGQYTVEPTFESGGGGLCSTVADYLRFLRMVVRGGELDGVRILQPETLALMRTNQLPDGVEVAFPMWSMPHTVFGLGFAIKTRPWKGEPASAEDEYHWGGMAGTHSWMAPRANLTGFCLTQRMPGYWHPFSHDFRRLVYAAAG